MLVRQTGARKLIGTRHRKHSRSGIGPDRLVHEEATQAAQAVLRATEGEFELLGPDVVAAQRVLAEDAHATVQVRRGVDEPLAALGRVELRPSQRRWGDDEA